MHVLPTHYHPGLVALSLLVAVVSSYVALDLVGSVSSATGWWRRTWLTCGAVAMGFGIWSMHFIGMLAFEMPGMAMAYDIPLMTLSILVAVVAAGCALLVMSRPRADRSALVGSAVAMAAAIAGMHYLGMYSMRMAVEVEWNYALVAASLVIAFIASLAAFIVAEQLPRARHPRRMQGGAAVLMGLAIAGMHYTGMEAATFRHTTTTVRQDAMVVASSQLTAIVVTATSIILGLALFAAMIDRLLARRASREREHARKASDAESASQLKTRFLANMSHEIRTPLGAILGFAELLLEEDLEPARRREHARTILRSARSLSQLLDDVLDLSKIEMDRVDLELRPVNLRSLVRDVMNLLKIKADEKGLEVEFRDDGTAPDFVNTDPTRLRQIMVNILGNAIKFTARGTVRLTLGRNDGAADALTFTITDTGIGIATEQWPFLFQPFSQADNSTTRRFGGTGLGLDISRRLARALGGDVELVASTNGLGSTFRVTVTCDVASAAATEPAAGDAAAWPRLDGIDVLMVEDNPDNQMLITHVLERQGARLTCAPDGGAGVRAATEHSFDVILMDIQMPVMNGFEATRAIRAAGSAVPIIALTAHALPEERAACYQNGCHAYLPKPINFGNLIMTIWRLARPAESNLA